MTEEIEKKSVQGRAKSRVGIVTSNKMQKTVVVRVQRRVLHSRYGKYVLRAVKYKAHAEAHDPKNPTISQGDVVRIVETRPLSKDKFWRVAEVVRQAPKA
ncbi:MAG: 30S ribosomal protein S17 [Myxococcales bacterium]|nr:30S ribosomal protein S17 [Myxococcales bacterium]